MKNNYNNNVLYILPKYEKHMEYVLRYCLVLLPRTEKFNIGNEVKFCMKCIVAINKVADKEKMNYINNLDV